MRFRRFAVFLIVVLCLALSGCATARRLWLKPKPASVVGPHQIGTVYVVNLDSSFVLIDAWEMPKPGTVLKTQPQQGSQPSVLKVCPQQRPPFATADITVGAPKPGDGVFQ